MRASSFLCLVLCGCGGPSGERHGEPLSNDEGGEQTSFPDANDPAYAARFDGTVDPRVSTSRGAEGGIVVLWPRVVGSGSGEGAEASEVHSALTAIAGRQGREVDVRPEPERVCPQEGCAATAVGAVLLQSGGGCAVVATISQPGRTPARLVRWAGEVELRNTNVPFREPPEQHVRTLDMARCAELGAALSAGEAEVEQAIREALPQ